MFIDATKHLADNPIQLNYGVAVTDIDRDGIFELIVAGFATPPNSPGAPNLVLKWDGRRMVDIADEVLADMKRQAIGVAAGDIDGDGQEELYILNTDTFGGTKRYTDRLFAHNGLDWTDLFSIPMNAADLNLTAGRSVACVDRNGDGRYGMFVANYGGPMRLYEVDEDGFVRDVAEAAGVNLTTGGRVLLSFPLVSEGMDVFAGNERGPNFLFRNNGDGTFTDIADQAGLQDHMENVRGAAPLDVNGNGRFDLVYGNWEGPHRLFVQTAPGVFEDVATPEFALPSRVRSVIVADFDNDGHDEIFFNNIGQPNRLFRVVDDQLESVDLGEATEPNGFGTGAVVGDFDYDGQLELLISHGETGGQPLSYYRTPPNDNAFLRVLPKTRHGAPARGAVVRLFTEDRNQMRAIDAGSGYLCQMEPIAHFGLGSSPSEVRVEIQWPDGASKTIENPILNRILTITHPDPA